MLRVSVPEFSTIEEFITWWQKPQVRSAILQDPQNTGKIASHPNITVWLDKLFEGIQDTVSGSLPSREESVRLLATSSPADSAFVAEAVRHSMSGAGETGEIEAIDTLPSFGRYRIKRKIAEGGFGAVYEAYDPQLDRTVALKLLKLRTEAEIEQFEKEARLVAKLRHPNIIAVHELGVLENQPYFAMDFIDGKTLRDVLQEKGRLLKEEAFRIAATVADTLSYAHSNGIIHRDMKPENIFIDTAGRVYVGDFGIAKKVKGGKAKVTSSRVVGTPHYMSPEQSNGESLDARSDVWALGVTLYEMLCGTCPFEGRAAMDIFKKIWFAEPIPLRKLLSKLDRDAETIVIKCLQKDLGRRYASAAKLKADIGRYLKGEHIEARPIGIIEKSWRRIRRHKALTLSIAVGLLTVIMVTFFFWRRGQALSLLKDGMASTSPEVAVEKIERALDELGNDWSARQQYGLALERAGRADEALESFRKAEEIAQWQKDSENRTESLYRIALIYWNNQDFEQAQEIAMQAEELAQDRRTVTSLTLQARRLTARNEHEKALEIWEQTFELDKGNPITLFYKAGTLHKLKDYDSAVSIYTRALWEFEKTQNRSWLVWCFNNRGLVKFDGGDCEGAIIDYDEALRLDSGSILALHNRALAKQKKNDYAGAIADINEALRIDSTYANAYKTRGDFEREAGDYDNAIADYNEAIRLKSDFVEAYDCRGNTRKSKGDLEGALDDYNKAIELNPEHPSAYNNRGWLRYQQGDCDSAMADYEKANELDPSFALVYRNIGRVMEDRGEVDEAVSFYNKAIDLNPEDADAYNNRGNIFSNRGNQDAALTDFNKAIDINPSYALLYNNRGLSRQRKGDIEAAVSDYNEAIRLDPEYAMPYYNRARIRDAKGDKDGAIEDYTKAVEVDPQYSMAYNNRGWTHYRKKQFDLAYADYNKAIETDATNSLAYNNRGIVSAERGDLKQAIADFSKAIELDPRHPYAYVNRASARDKTGDFDGAIEDYTKALEIKPGTRHYYNNRGWAYQKKNDLDNAIKDYMSALKIDPRYITARWNMASALQKQGKSIEAIETWSELLEIDSEIPEAYSNRGLLLHHLGRYAEAIADYGKLVELAPENATAWYNLACAYAKLGEKDKALTALEKSLELDESGELKQGAASDTDFESLRNDPKFKRLTEE